MRPTVSCPTRFSGGAVPARAVSKNPERNDPACPVGKSDHIDAEAAARAVLAGRALAIPKTRDGAVEAVRVLRVARRSAVRARTQTHNQITALIGASHDTLRAELRPLPSRTRIHTCAGFDPVRDTIDPIDATLSSLGVIARRW